MTLIGKYFFTVTQNDLDMFGHVNHAKYVKILEAARWDFIKKYGYDHHIVNKLQVGFVVVDIQARYQRELVLGESAEVISEFFNLNRRIITANQTIVNTAKQVCVSATVRFAHFDMKTRQLVSPPKLWLKCLNLDS